MAVALIGRGAIARYVAAELQARGVPLGAWILRREGTAAAGDAPGAPVVTDAGQLPAGIDLIVDCAGHGGLAQHGPGILGRGMDLITVSLGALADDDLFRALDRAAMRGGARLHLASGAIGALDCLAAARVGGLDRVAYVGRKPPAGWKGSPAEAVADLDSLAAPCVHFQGSARRAAVDYPRNANVAAAVALAGIGFEDTQVQLIADPSVSANVHEVHAEGAFGQFAFRIEGRALPDNPRSSALAAMSVVAAILRQRARIVI